MTEIINFGRVALAGAFLLPEQFASETFYPLRLYFCDDCFAVQVVDKVNAHVLFDSYFYYSSSIKTLQDHFVEYAAEVTDRFLSPERSTVVEFGCNDGVLLRPLADRKIRTVIGVDPATNIVKTIDDPRIEVVNDFFSEEVAEGIVARHGPADMVVANNVYAHIPDIQGVTRAVSKVLADDGVFIFEVHYLGKVVGELQYDMIYHEHLYYYSLLALNKHFARYDMIVFDVKPVPIHGGSMRFYVCKKGSKHSAVSAAARALENEEVVRRFDRRDTFLEFAGHVAEHRAQLMALLDRLKRQGHTIAGYGASGRANTMIQYCGIDRRHLDYMIDDAPAKQGFFTPGSHFAIHSSRILDRADPPEYLLIFAWSFFDEIRRRNARYLERGGRMILPLPKVEIVPPLESGVSLGAN